MKTHRAGLGGAQTQRTSRKPESSSLKDLPGAQPLGSSRFQWDSNLLRGTKPPARSAQHKLEPLACAPVRNRFSMVV